MEHARAILLLFGGLATLGCGASEPVEPGPAGYGGWTPDQKLSSQALNGPRGLLDLRGIIHAHSVYSHDACDGEPRDEQTGAIDEACLADFRGGICRSAHDFVMLTDHSDSFRDTPYPDVLLHLPEQGDELVKRDGSAVANWVACKEGQRALVMAGTETATMPVGLEAHVADTPEQRGAIYGSTSDDDLDTIQQHGAVVLLQHTEDWSVDQIVDMKVDGFEMFNLHANTITGAGGAVSLLTKTSTPELLPQSDLVFMPIVNEDARYLDRWSGALAKGAHRVTTMGTDCHRNTFPQMLPDGERIDSYRRMMVWFSNHLLVEAEADGSWDDRHLKDALRGARLYGAFELLGYPEGFDFHAQVDSTVHEMGAVGLSLQDSVELVVKRPRVRELAEAAPQPELRVRLLRATAQDGWQLVAESSSDAELRHTVTEAGAYRAEVRMKPRHLEPFLASYAELAEQDFVWIYANAIHVK